MKSEEKQQRFLFLKIQETKKVYTFMEIVIQYNAKFGTNHFSELLSNEVITA
jgi:hypothetical protein